MKKSLLGLLICLTVMANAFTEGQKDDGNITIGYSFMSAQDVFQNLLKNEFVAACEAQGIEVKVIDPMLDIEKQVASIETFISLNVDAIVCSPLDYTGLIPAVKMANEANIPFVAVNTEIDPSAGTFKYVGSLNYDAGFIEGEYMAKVLPENAKIVYLRGAPGYEHTISRREGVQNSLLDARPDVELLSEQNGKYDRLEGMKVMEDWLQVYGDSINGVLAANDQMSLGALEALKAAGIEGVMMAGIDGTDEAVQNVKNGSFTITVLQDAKGIAATALQAAMDMVAGNDIPDRIIVPFKPITKENVDEYL